MRSHNPYRYAPHAPRSLSNKGSSRFPQGPSSLSEKTLSLSARTHTAQDHDSRVYTEGFLRLRGQMCIALTGSMCIALEGTKSRQP